MAGATDDDSVSAGQAGLPQRALGDAGVDHTLEFCPARHGFAVPGNPTYDTQATPGTGKYSASSTGPTRKAPEAHAKPLAQAGVTQRARHGGWSRAHIAADMASRADRDLDCAGLTELVVMFAASGA